MKKISFYVLIFCSLNIFAQNQDLTSAIISFQKNDLNNAKMAIDKATDKIDAGATLKPKKMAKFYHYKGLIYFRQFQTDTLNDSRILFLDVATESFLQDASLNSSFSKKSISQLNMCANNYSVAAYDYYQSKKYDLALKNFTSAINIQESSSINNVDLNTIYAAALSAKNAEMYQESIKWSSKLVEMAPDSTIYHITLIKAYESIGDLEGQLNIINKARLALPQSQDIIFEEVNYYISSGDNSSLLKSLDEAVQKDSTNAMLYFVLGSTYASLGDIDKAITNYEQSISLDKNLVDAHNNLAAIYLDEANIYIEKKNSLPINASQKKYNNLSVKIKNLRLKALPSLEQVLVLQPKDEIIIQTLKQIYYQLEMDKESLAMKRYLDSITNGESNISLPSHLMK